MIGIARLLAHKPDAFIFHRAKMANLHIMHLLSMTAMDLLGKLYLFEVVPENQF